MTTFVFAALIFTAVIVIFLGTAMAVALRRSPQEQVTMEATGPGSDLSITETESAPDWPTTPAHLRMW
jgi:hypothetical protein